MPSLNVSVPLTPAYNAAFQQLVTINQTTSSLSIPIQDGSSSYTSQFQQVGSLKYFAVPILEAAIRVSYDYDSSKDVLTLYGNDVVDPDKSTCLITRPVNSDQSCQQHTYNSDSSPCGSNPNWNYSSPQYTPGLPEALRSSVIAANNAIIEAAKTQFPIVRVKTPPPVFETIEETHKWMSMHDENGNFIEHFDPNKEYPAGIFMSNIVMSTWGGEAYFNLNQNIANVIGSSRDPQISGKPWIELWERQFGLEDQCTSHNWASGEQFVCNDNVRANIVGGHVIEGTVPSVVQPGDNNVYIIPICKNHNNNDNVYMRANVYRQAIWLNNYLQSF